MDKKGKTYSASVHQDEGKLRVELVPPEAIEAIAEILTYGCTEKKPLPYKERSWEEGMLYSRLMGSVMRHVLAYAKREDKDYESSKHPLKHALCDLAMLVTYIERGMGEFDDRPQIKKKNKELGDSTSELLLRKRLLGDRAEIGTISACLAKEEEEEERNHGQKPY